MPKTDPRVDAYIKKAAPFAQPILKHLRQAVHTACPDAEETIKWGVPAFTYHGLLCVLAGFKAHCGFNIANSGRLTKTFPELAVKRGNAGQFGRITNVGDLPAQKKIVQYLKLAATLNAEGIKKPTTKKSPKPFPAMPGDLQAALRKNRIAAKNFAELSPSCQREYLEWILEAKREETRTKRVTTTVEWLAEGKSRNWKYQGKK